MLVFDSVNKKIGQSYHAYDLNLHAKAGRLYALVGEAGSGKSTVFKMAAGVLKPDSGNIFVQGRAIGTDKKQNSRLIGYMGQKNAIYPRLHVLEYLELYAHIYGYYGLSARERCLELLNMLDLERRADTAMDDMPDSSLRCLEFLRTLIHNPLLLLLDNPFLGMDAKDKMMLQEVLSQLASEGTAVVLSSASLADAMDFSQDIGLLDKGRMMAEGSRESVMDKVRESAPLYIEIGSGREQLLNILRQDPFVKSMAYDKNYFRIHYTGREVDEAALLRRMVEAGVMVGSFHRGQGSLEELIRHLS